ncbi:MAG: hypothetical protein ACYC3X_01385 [Pirellulaceae bacterium]
MRAALVLLAGMTLCVGLCLARCGDAAKADESSAVPGGGTEYSVDCRIISEKLTFAVPRTTVRDGVMATVADTTERSVIIAEKVEANSTTPIRRVFTEGTTIEMTVTRVGPEKAVLDLTVQLSAVCPGSPPRVNALRGQVAACLSMGQPVRATLGDWTVEAVVSKANNAHNANK